MSAPLVSAPYADSGQRLRALLARAGAAYVAWARDPRVGSAPAEHLKAWAAAYELRAALGEQNPAWAATLSPALGTVAGSGTSLPTRPVGVYWQVDAEGAPGTVTLTLDVQGVAPDLTVLPPGLGAVAFRPGLTLGVPRCTCTFKAPADGLYALELRFGPQRLTTLYVPVLRAEWRAFRAHSRQLAYPYGDTLPRPTPAYRLRLALLAAAEAAARTSQVSLYTQLVAALAALPAPPTPVHLSPYSSRA